ncbi:Protein kinase superfamily protein [Rhynchospora pubera]|uniref:Protein kinase superfamily protein n=1 Tax=Rhynchospora pubera TaxID=906938 RepID=A0AAV8E9X8_9POAL|nr:Protein kinase superfamily protein [Rhynchospora pubera]
MRRVAFILFTVLHFSPLCLAKIPFFRASGPSWQTFSASSPSWPPEVAPSAPTVAPQFSPISQPPASPGFVVNPPRPQPKHHKREPPHAYSPFPSPQAGCDDIICSEPLTATPIGSPCGCVFPMKFTMDLDVAPYLLFMHIGELEVEVASGTFLKQSQVKIMAAVPSIEDQQKTRVTIYLVPLREKFDDTTALLIYERVWQKRVPISSSVFGDYKVVSVEYPGLPSSPPTLSEPSTGAGPTSSRGTSQQPLTADVGHTSTKSQKLNTWIIAVITVSSCFLLLVCVGVVIFVLRQRNLRQLGGGSVGPTTTVATKRFGMSISVPSSLDSAVSAMATYPPSVKTFSLEELSKATESFSSKRVLGEGGFGRVYQGTLESGTDVAVKLLTREDRSGDREFIAEVEMLSRLHHKNLVKLIGICIEGSKRCLVYELVRNGSVESHLHGVDKKKELLDWEIRMKVALGAARGLAYLHEDANPRVIHRDFKASNILLEEDFTPKVTDFGLAREATEGINHISTRVMGTFGYVAPEYAMTGHLLVKSDVYSYGVVLLELLSGRKPVYMSESQGPENLVTWARPLLGSQEGLEKLIDPALRGNYDFDNVAKVASIASMCVHIEPSQRPFMGEVVQALKLVYNDVDEACDDSYSHRESSSNADYDYSRGEFSEGGWWNSNASAFITMDYSSGGMEAMLERPHSAASVDGGQVESMKNRSGPLRTKKKRFASFYRSRGSVSEHARLPIHSRDMGL